jgi:glycosyltransferase involved in cell wall biosynthesis
VLSDDVCVLVEPDPQSMAVGLVRALSDQEQAARMVANARKLYDENYARPIYVRKIRELLQIVS